MRGNDNVGECAKNVKRKNRKYPGVNHSAGNCCCDRGEGNVTEKVRSFPFSPIMGSACFFSNLLLDFPHYIQNIHIPGEEAHLVDLNEFFLFVKTLPPQIASEIKGGGRG